MTRLTAVLFILLVLTISKAFASESISISNLGLTLHGPGNEGSEKYMVRKIEGSIVYNPEFNVVYKKDQMIYNAAVLSDCFGNTAYNLGMGKMYRLSDTMEYGWLVSLYSRKRMDALDDPRVTQIKDYNVLLLPWGVVSKDFVINEQFSLTAIISSNIVLTHAIIGLKYNFGGK